MIEEGVVALIPERRMIAAPGITAGDHVQIEKTHVDRLNKAIVLCREKDDNGSRMLLEEILRDTEEAVDWIEAEQDQIAQMGIENYLAQQVKGEQA